MRIEFQRQPAANVTGVTRNLTMFVDLLLTLRFSFRSQLLQQPSRLHYVVMPSQIGVLLSWIA
jgi:hypothetical protein